uniref:Transmembrane protein n=1 Tax=Toxocara canis TaxID=6265 RepID=A0A183UZU0_TOXCA
LKRAASVRACPADSLNVVRISRSPLSSSTSTSSESRKIGQQGAKDRSTHEDDRKRRKRYALGGCLVTMFFSTHAILLWRRRSEFRTLNKILPPVDWENFANEYLVKGRVGVFLLKSIVYQPHFHVGDAYLHCSEEDEREKLKKHFLSTYCCNFRHCVFQFRAGPEKFARTPDVRFRFDGDSDALELAIKKTLGDARKSCDIHLEINRFPSYR